MKRITALIFLVILVTGLTACGNSGKRSEENQILGEWQAYGIKTDDEISSYDDELDNKAASAMKSNFLVFRDNGKVKMKSNALSVEGTYKEKDNQYELTFSLNDSNEKQQFTASLDEDNNLILTQELPDMMRIICRVKMRRLLHSPCKPLHSSLQVLKY